MTELRLVWSCKSSGGASPVTRPKPAKCGLSPTASPKSPSLLKKFEKLQKERPVAAAVIERWVDQALADLGEVS